MNLGLVFILLFSFCAFTVWFLVFYKYGVVLRKRWYEQMAVSRKISELESVIEGLYGLLKSKSVFEIDNFETYIPLEYTIMPSKITEIQNKLLRIMGGVFHRQNPELYDELPDLKEDLESYSKLYVLLTSEFNLYFTRDEIIEQRTVKHLFNLIIVKYVYEKLSLQKNLIEYYYKEENKSLGEIAITVSKVELENWIIRDALTYKFGKERFKKKEA